MHRGNFLENFNSLYKCIGEQDNKEQMQMMPLSSSLQPIQQNYSEDEESDVEMDAEE